MSPATIVKVGLPLAAAATLCVMGAVIASKNKEEAVMRETIRQDAACRAAILDDAKSLAGVCSPDLLVKIAEARTFAQCERQLATLKEGAPGVCPPNVMAVALDRDAARDDAANLKTELAQARAATTAAVNRAVAREQAAAKRSRHADTVIAGAPRDDSGLVVLDAERLRQLGRGQARTDP